MDGTTTADLLQRLEERSRHLKTFLAAAEQAASEAARIFQQIGHDDRDAIEAQYNRLADAEETLHKVMLELGELMGELEQTVAPVETKEYGALRGAGLRRSGTRGPGAIEGWGARGYDGASHPGEK